VPDCYFILDTNATPGKKSPEEVLQIVQRYAFERKGWLESAYFDRDRQLAHIVIGLPDDVEPSSFADELLAELDTPNEDVTLPRQSIVISPHELDRHGGS
jgi:hypothetical protein